MASENMESNEIYIRISAENGNQVLKENQLSVGKHSSDGGDVKTSQSQSYLSSLSDTLKSIRQDTNSLLTKYIESHSTNSKTDSKDDELMEDDDSSDNDNSG